MGKFELLHPYNVSIHDCVAVFLKSLMRHSFSCAKIVLKHVSTSHVAALHFRSAPANIMCYHGLLLVWRTLERRSAV